MYDKMGENLAFTTDSPLSLSCGEIEEKLRGSRRRKPIYISQEVVPSTGVGTSGEPVGTYKLIKVLRKIFVR